MRAMTQLPDISIAIGGTVQMMFEKLQQRKKSNNVYNIQTHLFRIFRGDLVGGLGRG